MGMSSIARRRARARELLGAFSPQDAEERAHHARMQALEAVPGDPFARDHYEPGHFTASAFVLSPDRGSLLLILHSKLHRWLQPGGHVDPDDPDLEAAARREVAEETGVVDLERIGDGPLDLDVHAIPSLKGAPAHEHHDVRYLFRARSLSATAGSDAVDFRWVPLAEIATVESDRSVMRAVEKIRQLLAYPG